MLNSLCLRVKAYETQYDRPSSLGAPHSALAMLVSCLFFKNTEGTLRPGPCTGWRLCPEHSSSRLDTTLPHHVFAHVCLACHRVERTFVEDRLLT